MWCWMPNIKLSLAWTNSERTQVQKTCLCFNPILTDFLSREYKTFIGKDLPSGIYMRRLLGRSTLNDIKQTSVTKVMLWKLDGAMVQLLERCMIEFTKALKTNHNRGLCATISFPYHLPMYQPELQVLQLETCARRILHQIGMKFQAVSTDQMRVVETGKKENAALTNCIPKRSTILQQPCFSVPKRFPAAIFSSLPSILLPNIANKARNPGQNEKPLTSGIMYTNIHA